jgi:hypothetical protein
MFQAKNLRRGKGDEKLLWSDASLMAEVNTLSSRTDGRFALSVLLGIGLNLRLGHLADLYP